MLSPLPTSAIINVSSSLAGDLHRSATRLPLYDNREFYSPHLQTLVRDCVRETCPEGFDWLISSIKERTDKSPYCALVQGLRFDDGNRLFIAINRAFGKLVAPPYEKPRAQLVHYIQPASDIHSKRGGRESERLHTDTADWNTPVELISMRCVRADRAGGGRSRVLDIDAVRDEVGRYLGAGVLNLLETEPVPWRLAPYLGGGVGWQTVLSKSSLRWRRYTINLALEAGDIRLRDELLALLEAFENVISSTDRTIEFLMSEEEWLFTDNWRTVHARTPISEGDASDRLMLRSWIRTS